MSREVIIPRAEYPEGSLWRYCAAYRIGATWEPIWWHPVPDDTPPDRGPAPDWNPDWRWPDLPRPRPQLVDLARESHAKGDRLEWFIHRTYWLDLPWNERPSYSEKLAAWKAAEN